MTVAPVARVEQEEMQLDMALLLAMAAQVALEVLGETRLSAARFLPPLRLLPVLAGAACQPATSATQTTQTLSSVW